jgi:tetratricopeptide (TPR) repeat protein
MAVAAWALTVLVFLPALSHDFVNWDDPETIVANTNLHGEGVVGWAFTTTHMSHYQPLSWLAWAWLGGSPASAARYHGLSLVAHATNVALVLLLGWALTARLPRGRGTPPPAMRSVACAAAALLFGLHPLRVEPVAWASAFPYLLSYGLAIGSLWLWLRWLDDPRARWPAGSLALFLLSQLARVSTPLLPVVLAGLSWADGRAPLRRWGPALAPFLAIALALGAVEAASRPVEDLATIGVDQRLAWLLSNPFVYLWRTVAPAGLTPLDVLPLRPTVSWASTLAEAGGFAALVAATARAWSARAALVLWGGYLCLLLPVLGLTPSGLQATADRYTYGPAILLSAALAIVAARWPDRFWRPAGAVAVALLVLLAGVARGQLEYWRGSVPLWTRAAAIDPENDVALYNLAIAHAAEGRTDAAAAAYARVLELVPEHDVARRALARLLADEARSRGDDLAARGAFAEAVRAYDEALAADPDRGETRINRGMALVSLGELERAVDDLRTGVRQGAADPSVFAALSYALLSTGRSAEAIAVLRDARGRHPADAGLASNLARVLATADDPALRNAAEAVRLAEDALALTGGRDPRVRDTAALAYAAAGRPDRARTELERAVEIAEQAGDAAIADELRARLSRLTGRRR